MLNAKKLLITALLVELMLTVAVISSIMPAYAEKEVDAGYIKRGFFFNFKDSPSAYGPYYDWCQTWFTGITPNDVQKLQSYGTKVMLYRNLRAIYAAIEDYQIFVDNNWTQRDRSGEVVYSASYGIGYQIVDIGNPAVQDHIASWIAMKISEFGFDGVLLDNSFGLDKWTIFYDANQQPINPRTGEEWTPSEIQTALIECHSKIKAAIGNKTLVANGLYTGSRYFNDLEEQESLYSNSTADGVMSEGAFYMDDGKWLSELEWKQSVDALLIQTGTYEKFAVIYAYNDVLPDGCTDEQMFLFGLCSTLLSVQSNASYYGFGSYERDNVQFMETFGQAFFDTANALGTPVSDYQRDSSGVYVRYFQRGIICVNPTGTTRIFEDVVVDEHSGKIILDTVPEFTLAIIVPFFMIATLPVVILYRKRSLKCLSYLRDAYYF